MVSGLLIIPDDKNNPSTNRRFLAEMKAEAISSAVAEVLSHGLSRRKAQ